MVARASSVMTRGVLTVSPGAPLEQARALLTGNRFSALPVVDGGHRLVGIVTTLDVLRAEVEGRADATVGEVMTREPMTMGPDAPLNVLSHRLRHYGEKRVMPIVERGVLVGIVTRGDLLRPSDDRPLFDRLLGSGTVDDVPPPPDGSRVGTTAGEVMTPIADLVVATPSTGVRSAATWLSANRLTCLPVLDDDDRLLGVVSEADLVPDRLSGRRGPPPTRVGDAMTTGATAVRHDVPIVKVARAMISHRFRVLPVLDDDGRVVGMVSRGDLLRAEAPSGPPPGSPPSEGNGSAENP